ncbi:redoxin domain-containing protein [Flammeovirga yaeyamensis]|uniref:thioredoxin-dependent peroxiredoxin n=1 Tax=Flammeovirga yaeyamensis TaxID=367791 RepID=A0AAX1N5K5_9BACT|nr:peroxiredoxin-like family protein [Flammeovirga yaeyamensis]MBB3697341.1 peroxiredoxin [Flammeovirga yaeyamensis]NMF36035.1 AhpC/TSA family protein [Flammeovirga yaeyamensis]QWG02770.1 redoxin domain-containing protein [Flammeovirga yaeyamensis]
MKHFILTLSIFIVSLSSAFSQSVPKSANDISPLLIGEYVPEVTLRDVDSNPVDLKKLIKKKPTVLIFYRGGWCPYCNRQLSGLGEISDYLVSIGYQIVAISPDTPDHLSLTYDKHMMNYMLLSDSDMKASKKFGLAFELDDKMFKKFSNMGMDIVTTTGEKHNMLPVPAVFFVKTNGEISFEYINPNFKKRISSSLLVTAAETMGSE